MGLLDTRYLPTKTFPFAAIRDEFRAPFMQEGIVDVGDFAVTQRGAGANMSVDVADGAAIVQGDDTARQGVYEQINDATVNVAIAANASGNPRIDAIVLQINDSSVVGVTDIPALTALQGTPTVGATLANLSGKPAIPNSALLLAYVLVPNAAASILNANIGGLYDPRQPTLGAVAGAPPQYAHGRPRGYVPTCAVYRNSAPAAVAAGVAGYVLFDTEILDNDAMHDLAINTSQVSAKTPGWYLITAHAAWASGNSTGSYRLIGIEKNGSVLWGVDAKNPSGFGIAFETSIGVLVYLGYGDYVRLKYQHDATASIAPARSASLSPELRATWQGPGA